MHDDIDRILADEEHVTPSPGFLDSVMKAVEVEAAAPRSSAFPWLRALPGLLAMVAAFAVATWHGISLLRDPAAMAVFDQQLGQLTSAAAGIGLQWITVAVAITIVSMMLPSCLVRSSNDIGRGVS